MFGENWLWESHDWVHKLLSNHFCFVRARDPESSDKIRAFVSLPVLFGYWEAAKDESNLYKAFCDLSCALKTKVLPKQISNTVNQNAAALEEGVMNLFYIRLHLLAAKKPTCPCKVYFSEIFPYAHIPDGKNYYVLYDKTKDQKISTTVDGDDCRTVFENMLAKNMNVGHCGDHPVFYKQGEVPAKLIEFYWPSSI